MKTLYINISGEKIANSEDIIVLGKPEDAIINKFYYELGREILRGIDAQIASSIKKKDIVVDFKFYDEEAYNKILIQWEKLKNQYLLGERPTGYYEMLLPREYIDWLNTNSHPVYPQVAKSLYDRGCKVGINIDKMYRNIVGLIVNNIEPNDYGQFVINDNVITDESAIVLAIQEKIPNAIFIPFEEWGQNETAENVVESLEKKTDSDYVFVLQGENGTKLYDKEGRISSMGSITLRYNLSSYQHDPYIIGVSSIDNNWYYISSKQTFCLGNSKDKSIWQELDGQIFSVKDKYDYFTYYKITNGICSEITKEEYGLIEHKLPFYMDEDDDDMLTCISSKTGRSIEISGFKAFIYLGHNGQEDIFWATKNYSPDQYRFKESFIVNIKGKILRNYEYHVALPLAGKYILNIRDGIVKAITDLNGNLIINCNIECENYNLVDIEEIEFGIYKFEKALGKRGDDLFWLEKENILCHHYNRHFYGLLDKNDNLKIYNRKDNTFIGNGYVFVEELADDIYFVELVVKGDIKYTYLNKDGVEIYSFTNENHESPHQKCPEGSDTFQPCGVSENRIIINVDDRYYKILDYEGNEIVRIDGGMITGSYHDGKLYYCTNDESGYYDYRGEKHLIPFQVNKYDVWDIIVLKNDMLLIKNAYVEQKDWIISAVDGKVLLKGKILYAPILGNFYNSFLGDFIAVRDDDFNTVIYDMKCNKLFATDCASETIFVMNNETKKELR